MFEVLVGLYLVLWLMIVRKTWRVYRERDIRNRVQR